MNRFPKSGLPTLRQILTLVFAIAFLGVTFCFAADTRAQERDYPVPQEAMRQDGVPEGKIEGPFELASSIYPGTQRQYWIYVPAQYDAAKPACTMIVQDGLSRAEGWRVPTICDNLIHAGEMPVTIGIFVTPGVVPADKPAAQPRFNRSFEYDSMGDRYANFLLQELIPEVSKTYNLSNDANDRLLAGASSGGICAFNAAWERPDAFRRVLSTIGTFVGLRGANDFPTLVRKHEPKPLRVFLQDGSGDLNIYAGDWWVANQDMLSALTWAGYDVHHVWGEGGHNGKHGAAIMPEALRWLWRDYPNPIKANVAASKNRRIDLLTTDSEWSQVSSGHESAGALACSPTGEIYFCDMKIGRIYRVGDDGKTRIFAESTGSISSMGFHADGRLFACKDAKKLIVFDSTGKESTLLDDTPCKQLITLPNGIYFTNPSEASIWFTDYQGNKRKVAELPLVPSAIAPTTDHAFMHVAFPAQQYTLHLQIAADATLRHRQPFGYLHLPYMTLQSGASAMAVDRESRAIVATRKGLQVMDQLGRVNIILSLPSTDAVSSLTFGGAGNSILYAAAGGQVFRRVLNTSGTSSFAPPLEPPRPGL